MKTRWSALFALFAAALVLAAGCSDGSSDDWDGEATATLLASGSSESGESASGEASGESASGESGSSESASGSSESGETSGSSDDSEASGSGSSESASGEASGGESASASGSGGSESASSNDSNGSASDAVSTGGSGETSGSGSESASDSEASGSGSGSEASGSGEASGSESTSVSGSGSSESGEASGSGSNDSNGSASDAVSTGGSASPGEIAESDVEELLKSIGKVKGNDSGDAGRYYWDFASGTLGTDDEGGYTFTVEWDNSGIMPTTKTTLPSLQEKGKVSTSLLALDLSDAEWQEKPKKLTNTTPATPGKVMAAIELADGASSSLTIPESLQSVTIVMNSDENWRIND